MVDGLGLGSFAQGAASGASMAMQANRAEEERQRIEEQRQQEMAAQREEMARQSLLAQQQRQQTGGMGMPDASSLSTLKGMLGGGETTGAGATTTGATTTTGTGTGVGMTTGAGVGTGAGAGAATAGGSGASSMGGAVAAAGPWAALAAVIGVNERSARNVGARRDGTRYWKDLAGGKVVEQDFNERIVPKIFGGYNDDKYGMAHEAGAVGELSTFDFKNAAKKLENGVAGNLLKKIF